MKPSRWLWAALAVLLPIWAGRQAQGTSQQGPTEMGYDVKEKVEAVAPAKPSVTLNHEDIPGLMKAMKMEFRVEDKQLLKSVQVGDKVQGRLKKADSGLVITQLKKQ